MATFMHVAIEQHASPKQVMRTEGSIACESRRTRGQSGSRMDLTSILRILANAKVQSILYYHTSDPSNRLLFAEAAMADARTTPMEFLSSTSPPVEQRRVYEASVIRRETERQTREVSRKTFPLFREEQTSREVWIGGWVPKWGSMGRRKTYYTEKVHYADRVDVTMVEEARVKLTYGSGAVTYGNWNELRRWVK